MGKELRPRRRGGLARGTPYDRPLDAIRNNSSYQHCTNDNGRRWFLKVLSPIASGAGKLFSSVFRRQDSSDSSTSASSDDDTDNNSEEDQEDNVQGVVAMKDGTVIEADIQGEPSSAAKSKLSEIENLLTSKTFTRDEFIHLTALLRSRVVDSSGLKEIRLGQYTSPEHCISYLRNEALEEAQRWREERRKSHEQSENGGLDSGLCGNVSTLALSGDVPDHAETSPVDIAKAYMGVRPTWASSSPVALQSYKPRENNSVKNVSFVPTTNEFWPVSNCELEDRFRTPTPSRLWNRMQSLPYNPYSRASYSQTPYCGAVYSQRSIQQNDNQVDSGTPSSSWTPIQSSITGGREILKRRSSVVDDGWAHAGPIRRIRPKSFGNIPLASTPYKGFHSPVTEAGSSISLFSSGLEAFRNSSIIKKSMDMDKNISVSTSFQVTDTVPKICGVPSHSTLTAHKILGNSYGKIASSIEKSAEEQLALPKDKTSNQLTMTETTNKDDGKAPHSETTASVMLEDKDFQANTVEVWGKKVHGSGEDAITHDIQTTKSVSIASDGDLNNSSHPTFKFGSGNTNKGPVFQFITNGTTNLDMDASDPKFDFKFESKRGTLFSAAVEAAVASQSSPQSALSMSPYSTSYSAWAGSRLGLQSNSSPFSSTLFGSSSVSLQGTSSTSTLFSTAFRNSRGSPGLFGFSKIGAGLLGTGNLPAFSSGSNSLFGLTSTATFSTGMSTYASASSGSFDSGAPTISSSGIGNFSTLAFGSGITSTSSSSTAFTINNIVSIKSNSTPSLFSVSHKSGSASSISFGVSPQIGSGTRANDESNKPAGLVESVETVVDTVPQTSIATEITNSTCVLGTTSIAVTAVVEGPKDGKMNGNDLEVPSKLSHPLPSVTASAEQTSSSTFSPTSVAVTIDSQSNAESSEGQPGAPSQNMSMSGVQNSFASAGDTEITGNGGDKRGRKIVRPKRDRTKRK